MVTGLATALASLLRGRVRGSVRLTLLFARALRQFQSFPVVVEGGTVFLDLRVPSSHCLFAGLITETRERNLMRRIVRRGQTALDIGAHWGLHTVLLSDLVGPRGRVVAFEPNPVVLSLLSHSVDLLANTTLAPFALSDSVGTAPLFVPAHADMAGLSDWARSADRESRRFDVRVDRLDRLVAAGDVPPPDFVKCDVEGFEARVFRGAASVLDRRQAPTTLFEVNPRAAAEIGITADAALEFLGSLGAASYRFFSITSGELIPLERAPAQVMNVLAIPEERMSILSAIQPD